MSNYQKYKKYQLALIGLVLLAFDGLLFSMLIIDKATYDRTMTKLIFFVFLYPALSIALTILSSISTWVYVRTPKQQLQRDEVGDILLATGFTALIALSNIIVIGGGSVLIEYFHVGHW